MTNLVIFASGSGTNAENIAKYFEKNEKICLKCIISNKKNAGVIDRAKRFKIPTYYFSNAEISKADSVLECLYHHQIDYIILAGFLSLIPSEIINAFPNRILNLHPALLPAYGGKGMYGDNVHRAVLEDKARESGISIHFVDEKYDEGKLILQAHCPVFVNDDVDSLANRIHKLEYRYFPQAIEQVVLDYSD